MSKGISLVAGTEQTRLALLKQLREYIDIKNIKSFAIDEGIEKVIADDIVILSSELTKQELIENNLLDLKGEIIVASRTIGYDHIDDIVLLPENTKVLFVNDVKETTIESIEILKQLGIDHIKYIPYYPGIKNIYSEVKIAITPGEIDKVPKYIEKIYDIGPRIMDFTTVTKLLHKLDLLDEMSGKFSENYLHKIINIAKRLAKSNKKIVNMNLHLNNVLDGLQQGLLVFDTSGVVSVFNENLKKTLKISNRSMIGMRLKNIIYNKNLLQYLMNCNEIGEKSFTIQGVDLIVNKFHLDNNDYTIATFKELKGDTNNLKEKSIITKGFVAKYTFDDIVTVSENMIKVKSIGKKLAKTDLTILIQGESGTGKELFASAIHKDSRRNREPFLAVNFSALPDELIESELFGYEDGAFTGAKKGGKAGLFEQAEGGTIFLDEIGDISLKVQARLLRVLQEKEVMRVGGNSIIPVNVNVIAATNKDLVKMIKENKFREDLYYRLKMGYVKIPPLRERKDDIEELIKYFVNIECSEEIQVSEKVINLLRKYDWYGNVRELKNTIDYMLAMRSDFTITVDDIPDIGFFNSYHISREDKSNKYACDNIEENLSSTEEAIEYSYPLDEYMIFILRSILTHNKNGKSIGRKLISTYSKETSFKMTESQVRTKMNKLEELKLIYKSKGRKGTCITEEGISIVENLHKKK